MKPETSIFNTHQRLPTYGNKILMNKLCKLEDQFGMCKLEDQFGRDFERLL